MKVLILQQVLFFYKFSGAHSSECCLRKRPVTGPFGFSLRWSSMVLGCAYLTSTSPNFIAVIKLNLELKKILLCWELSNCPQGPALFHILSFLCFLFSSHTDFLSILYTNLVHSWFRASVLPISAAICSSLQENHRSNSLPSFRSLMEATLATIPKIASPIHIYSLSPFRGDSISLYLNVSSIRAGNFFWSVPSCVPSIQNCPWYIIHTQ